MPTLRIADYPQLTLIAWNLRPEDLIAEDEAFALYERNWRFVDQARLDEKERALIDRLTQQYGKGVMNV